MCDLAHFTMYFGDMQLQ